MASVKTSTKRNTKTSQSKKTKQVVVYKCSCCGTEHAAQLGKFYRNYSPMFAANDNYNTVCMSCMARDYEHYLNMYDNASSAIKRMCEKYDYYFDREVAEAVGKLCDTILAFGKYISKLNLTGQNEKTFDLTLDEDYSHDRIMNATDAAALSKTEVVSNGDLSQYAAKWGYGYTAEQFSWLEAEYTSWVTRNECKSKSQEELFIILSQLRLDMLEARRAGADTKTLDTLTKSYLSVLDSAKLQPKQEGIVQENEVMSMGMFIKMIENNDPIVEPLPEWKDVDGIKKLIKIVIGGLAKMLGIKNSFVESYQQILDEFTVSGADAQFDDDVEDE